MVTVCTMYPEFDSFELFDRVSYSFMIHWKLNAFTRLPSELQVSIVVLNVNTANDFVQCET